MHILLYFIPLLFLTLNFKEWKEVFTKPQYSSSYYITKEDERIVERNRKATKIFFSIEQIVRIIAGITFTWLLLLITSFDNSFLVYFLFVIMLMSILLKLNDFNYGIFKLAFPYYFKLYTNNILAKFKKVMKVK